MDREKLNKAAEEYSRKLGKSRDVTWNDGEYGFLECFDWLMQQPLSERMTDEEKEKIRKIHQDYWQRWDCALNDRDADCSFYCFSLLERIFGAELFKEK